MQRFRPILMTMLVASLGLVPAALSHGIGSDSQRPFAIVIVGGLMAVLVMTIFLLAHRAIRHPKLKIFEALMDDRAVAQPLVDSPPTMQELPEDVHQKIQALSARGDEQAQAGELAEALESYWSAWDLIPEPKTKWEAATWVLAAIGDANFQGRDYVAGRDNLANAMRCPGAIGNPFLHLRLGQCQFEVGELDRAADDLMRAYMGAGPDIFNDQDPKYLAFLKTRAMLG